VKGMRAVPNGLQDARVAGAVDLALDGSSSSTSTLRRSARIKKTKNCCEGCEEALPGFSKHNPAG